MSVGAVDPGIGALEPDVAGPLPANAAIPPGTAFAQPPVPQVPDTAQLTQSPGGTTVPASTAPQQPGFEPPPPPPAIGPDPSANVQGLLGWHRSLTDWHTRATQAASATERRKAEEAAKQAGAEVGALQEFEKRRQEEDKRAAAERQQARKALADATEERATALKDLEAAQWRAGKWTGGQIVAAIAGGIGQAFQNMAAAQLGQVGHAQNEGLNTIQRLMDRELNFRKARVDAAGQSVLQARYGFKDAEENHRAALNDLDAEMAARWKLIAKEGERQARLLGADEATAKGNLMVAGAYEKAAEAELRIQQREEELAEQRRHNLAVEANSRAAIDARKRAAAAKRGGGGKTGADAMGALADYATQNPGDVGGLYREARRLGVDPKAVGQVINQTKSTGEQTKDARQAAIGLRAVDDIERLGYTPSKGEIQKWLNNQREVYQAQKAGEGGGIGGLIGGMVAGKAQGAGLMAQHETEGLSEKAAEYFSNVRRFMETIGRAQSGAAISNTEWTNFYNQYGPNSKGGLNAARDYLRDQFKVSGVAGRQLEASGSVPAREKPAAPAKPAPQAPAAGPKPSKAHVEAAKRLLDRKDVSREDKQAAMDILMAAGVI